MTTPSDIRALIEENGVKIVDIKFTDLFGQTSSDVEIAPKVAFQDSAAAEATIQAAGSVVNTFLPGIGSMIGSILGFGHLLSALF